MTTTSIDYDDANNNNNNTNGNSYYPTANADAKRRDAANVVYQSKPTERPKSCQGAENGNRSNSASPNQRKLSLSQDTIMMNEQKAGPSRSRSTTPQDMNQNSLTGGFISEEIVPGIIVEGYVEEF